MSVEIKRVPIRANNGFRICDYVEDDKLNEYLEFKIGKQIIKFKMSEMFGQIIAARTQM